MVRAFSCEMGRNILELLCSELHLLDPKEPENSFFASSVRPSNTELCEISYVKHNIWPYFQKLDK